jgi:hypothetical protein
LLDTHQVNSTGRALLFPGIIGPAVLVLGTTIGSWVLGILLVAPVWPMILVPHTIWSIAIGVPVGLLVFAGLNYTFAHPQPTAIVGDGLPQSILAEQIGQREPPVTRDLKS